MTESPPPQEDKPPLPPRDLNGWERGAAGLVGAIGTGVGGLGIFLSSNQAGTAVILILGVIFLLMAVQGTAVLRVSKDGGDFAARSAERRTLDKINEVREVQGSQVARAAIEAAVAARPELMSSPAMAITYGSLYEDAALEAIAQAWRNVAGRIAGRIPEQAWTRYGMPDWADAACGYSADGTPKFVVEVLYTSRGPLLRDRLARYIDKLNSMKVPYLIVSSSRTTAQTELLWKYLPRATERQFVKWAADDPIEDIERAIEKLIGQVEGDIPKDLD